jgi:RNA polymerase sigma-70 factor (ECF subfamily)
VNFDKVFQKYHHALYLYCLKFIDNEADAMDLVQNVFISVWEKEKFKLDEVHLKSYLFSSTRNACINYLKHSEVIRKFESEISFSLKMLEINRYSNGEQSLIEKEGLEKIYSAINSLTMKNREILELSRFEGLKNQEIAELLHIPIRTVETRLFRALKKLRELL